MIFGHGVWNSHVFNEEDEGNAGDPNAVLGCMDPNANNYDELATHDTIAGSCTYDPVLGCMDETANNYNELATVDDDSCTYDVVGCMDETACNYDETANIDGEDCKYGDECGMFSSFEDWQLAVGAVVLLLLLK